MYINAFPLLVVPRWIRKRALITARVRVCECAGVCCQMSLPVGYVAFGSAEAVLASPTANNNIADT